MKKWGLFVSSLLTILFLSACGVNDAVEPSEDGMIISIKNASDFDFYGIEVSAHGQTQGVINADESQIQKGDILTLEFTESEDFPLKGEKAFNFAVIDEYQNNFPLDELRLDAAANQIYSFEVSGKTREEAKIEQVE